MLWKFITALVFFIQSVSLALNLCVLTLANIDKDYEKLTSLRAEIKTGIYEKAHPPSIIEAHEIKSVETLSTEKKGLVNKGVFRVVIDGKPYVLKLRTRGKNADGTEKYQEGNLIHEILGQMGIAPKLKGVLSDQEMRKLGDKFPELFLQDKTTGLVMEEVKDAWNPKNTTFAQSETPKWVLKLNPKAIEVQMHHLKKVVQAMGINPSDLQVFINQQGKVFLGDLDFYELKDNPNSPAYQEVIDYAFTELTEDIKIYIDRGSQ